MSRKYWGFERTALLLAFGFAAPSLAARAEQSLCGRNEAIVFSCHVDRKIVSLCRPTDASQILVYRYGRGAKVELAVRGGGGSLPTTFWLENAPLIGGGETNVSFERSGYEYRLYSKVMARGGTQGEPEFEDGVVVLRNGQVARRMVCDDGGEGFREKIDWLPLRAAR